MHLQKTKRNQLQITFTISETFEIYEMFQGDGDQSLELALHSKEVVNNFFEEELKEEINWRKGLKKKTIALFEKLHQKFGSNRWISITSKEVKNLKFSHEINSLVYTLYNLKEKGVIEIQGKTLINGKFKITDFKLTGIH